MNKCSETKADNNVIREKSWLQWNPRTEIDSAHEKEKLRLEQEHMDKELEFQFRLKELELKYKYRVTLENDKE